jgi:hypothetical protein
VTQISFLLIGVSAYNFSILWYRFKNLVTPKSTMHIAQECKCKNHWCKYLLLIHQSFPNLGISSWNPCNSQISKQTLKKNLVLQQNYHDHARVAMSLKMQMHPKDQGVDDFKAPLN